MPAAVVVTSIAAGLAAAPAGAQVSGQSREASELNRRSRELYDQGRYAEAAALLREAYRRKPEPVLQYNLARTCEMMDDHACAVAAYESYLPHARPEERASIEARLARHRARLAAANAPPANAPVPPSPPASDPSGRTYGFLPPTVTVIGGVGLGVGLALASAARSKNEEAMADPTVVGAREKRQGAESLMGTANITLAASGVVAVTGIVWWILHARSGRGGPAKLSAAGAVLRVGAGSIAIDVAF